MKNPEALIDALERLRLRLQCGHALTQALSRLPDIKAPIDVCQEWSELRELMASGKVSAAGAVTSFIKTLRLKTELRQLVHQKSFGARAQGVLISVLAMMFLLAAYFLFPATVQPSAELSVIAAALVGIGAVWMQLLLRRFEHALWFADWVLFLARLASALKWGHMLAPALEMSQASRTGKDWPPVVQTRLECLQTRLRAHHPINDPDILSNTEKYERKALEHLEWLETSFVAGQPLSELLEAFTSSALDSFKHDLNVRAEKLGLYMLAPLFVCDLPAFLLLLLGPLLRLTV